MDANVLNPRESGAFIAKFSQHVKINDEGIKKASNLVFESIKDGSIDSTSWQATHDIPEGVCPVNWCFFANSINFSFWSSGDSFRVMYKGMEETGYNAFCALINKAIRNGFQLLEVDFYDQLSLEMLAELFTSDNGAVIPMINERFTCLKESAQILKEKFDGSFLNCVKICDNSAQKLLRLIVENFPSFRDVALYQDQHVSFLKRAQILVADVYGCLRGKAPANFEDLDSLTMFADYRVPQVLAFVGAFDYSPELKDLLKKEHLFENGEPMEVEIRGCSIQAVELITREVKNSLISNRMDPDRINSATIDYFLWCYRRQNAKKIATAVPFHRIRCIYY